MPTLTVRSYSNPHGWLWGVQDFSGGSNCRCGGNIKRTRGRDWRRDWTSAITDETLTHEETLLMNEQSKWFLEMETTLDEDTM